MKYLKVRARFDNLYYLVVKWTSVITKFYDSHHYFVNGNIYATNDHGYVPFVNNPVLSPFMFSHNFQYMLLYPYLSV